MSYLQDLKENSNLLGTLVGAIFLFFSALWFYFQLNGEKSEHDKTKKNLTDTENELATTKTNLDNKTNEYNTTQADLNDKNSRITDLQKVFYRRSKYNSDRFVLTDLKFRYNVGRSTDDYLRYGYRIDGLNPSALSLSPLDSNGDELPSGSFGLTNTDSLLYWNINSNPKTLFHYDSASNTVRSGKSINDYENDKTSIYKFRFIPYRKNTEVGTGGTEDPGLAFSTFLDTDLVHPVTNFDTFVIEVNGDKIISFDPADFNTKVSGQKNLRVEDKATVMDRIVTINTNGYVDSGNVDQYLFMLNQAIDNRNTGILGMIGGPLPAVYNA